MSYSWVFFYKDNISMVYCDLETFSLVPIEHGIYKYAEHAQVLLWAYKIHNSKIAVWDVQSGDPMPQDLKSELRFGSTWHNGHGFDSIILEMCLGIYLNNIDDTMLRAQSHGLPGGLDKLAEIFNIPGKMSAGKGLIELFCTPNKHGTRNTPQQFPAQWRDFKQYAKQDVQALYELAHKLPNWNSSEEEQAIVCLDRRINSIGFKIDTVLVESAIAALEKDGESIRQKVLKTTRGLVKDATQGKALISFFKTLGITMPDLQKSTVETWLNNTSLPSTVRELLLLRQSAARTSNKKYDALLKSISLDGRLKGSKVIYGAKTGRWAGRVFQPDNLPRPTLPDEAIREGVQRLKAGSAVVDSVSELCSSALRHCIIASDVNTTLVIADLSAIEGRVLAWLAGQEYKLELYRKNYDIYAATYARTVGQASPVTKLQRFIGKLMELSLGYAGGVGAFTKIAEIFNIPLDSLIEPMEKSIPRDMWNASIAAWEQSSSTLDEKEYAVVDGIKKLWRKANPEVPKLWQDVQDAYTKACNGTNSVVGFIAFDSFGKWVRIRLPSGRFLCYPSAKSGEDLSYLGVNPVTKAWGRIKTYGGSIVENVCQSVARDILAHNMLLIDSEDVRIVLHIHDEVVCEYDKKSYVPGSIAAMLAKDVQWAKGLPLAAVEFTSEYYRK